MATYTSDDEPDQTTGAWRIGTWLGGKYRLDAVLGAGGMAVVYAATHRNKKRVAVKMLLEPLSSRVDVRARFLREGYVANSVEHAGAVSVFDDDVAEDGTAYLVMELLEGQTVQDACRNAGGRLSVASTLCLAHALLETLSAAHAKNIVHRDIKPANLFMTHQGQLKVLDFGIARLREGGANEANTIAGMSLGTPAFMAPEQAMGTPSEVDAQSDVWSVGATMYRLLSGRKVHVGETSQHLIMLAAMTPAAPLAAVMPEADPRLAALVDRALAFAKKDRWPSAAAMKDEVAALYRSLLGDAGSLVTDAGSTKGSRTELHLAPPPPRVSSADATGPSTPVGEAFRGVGDHSAATTTGEPVSSGAVPAGRRGRRAQVIGAAIIGAAVALVVAIGLWHRSTSSPPSPSAAALPPAAQTAGNLPSDTASAVASGSPMPPSTAQVEAPAASGRETESRGGAAVAPSSTPQRPRRSGSPAPAPKPGTSPPPVTDFDRQ